MITDTHELQSEAALVEDLVRRIAAPERTAIVAGHFMLMYDDAQEALVPMIWQDAQNPKVREFSKRLAGDFPLRSFAMGTDLRARFARHAQEGAPKLALLVNDHIYQTPSWSHLTPEMDRKTHLKLKKAFYRSWNPLPACYEKMLGADAGPAGVFVDNSNPDRTRNDILPKSTFFFSESQLRNRFDKYTRDYLRLDPAFYEPPSSSKDRRLYFSNPRRPLEFCLTEGGNCGCSGEVIEFLMALLRGGYSHVVFFIPDECRHAAMAGIEAAVYHQTGPSRLPLEVFAVFGLGGMNEALSSSNSQLRMHHVRKMDA